MGIGHEHWGASMLRCVCRVVCGEWQRSGWSVVGRNDSVHGLLRPDELGKEKLGSVDGIWCVEMYWVRCVDF